MPTAPWGPVLTAMITPFTPNGEVDHERARRLARHLASHGSDGLVISGTTGESPTLSAPEKLALYRTVVEAVENKQTEVLAGTGTYDTAESVELSRQAAEVGVTGLMAVTPYYSKPSQRGIIAHFEAIADATELPVLVYNIPGRTGTLISVDTLAHLARHPRIAATKDAVMDLDFTSATVQRVPDLPVYSGQDSLTWPMMAVGAIGVVSVISHLVGDEVAAMVDAAAKGDTVEARRIHLALLDVASACFLEPNPQPVRSALNEFWEPVGSPRLPLIEASAETIGAIGEALSALRPLH